MKPIIGITLDYQTEPTFSSYPWYALRTNYFDAITQQGGVPLGLSCNPSVVEDYLKTIQGLVISGGNFDIDPTMYGEGAIHPKTRVNATRTSFEMTLIRGALDKNMPILGICGGHQLLNVALGGSLIQYIPDAVEGALSHSHEGRRHEGVHTISIEGGTHLASIAADGLHTLYNVNSSHQQAVNRLGEGVVVNAKTDDGVIEGIEVKGRPFCLGIQWHPEFHTCDLDQKIFQNFINAAGEYARG